ncbi:TPA: hypothetical protein ACPVYZ_004314 [Vibrio parahaemolyticus]
MSNQDTDQIASRLASAIVKSSEYITTFHKELSEQQVFEIKIKAITKSLLAVIENSDFAPVQLATNSKTWLGIGQIHVGGESEGAISTKMLLKTIQENVLKDEVCDCEYCQPKGDAGKVKKHFAKAFERESEPSLNEQTAQEILREIEAETRH